MVYVKIEVCWGSLRVAGARNPRRTRRRAPASINPGVHVRIEAIQHGRLRLVNSRHEHR